MKVAIRRKALNEEKEALFLDITHDGKRKKEYLKLYLLTAPKSAKEKQENKFNLELAESIRAKRLLELKNGTFGFATEEDTKIIFLDYFESLTKARKESPGNFGNWDSTFKHLVKYCPRDLRLKDIDEKWLEGFKTYLHDKARVKGSTPLAENSKHSYYNKVRACLRQAFEENLISFNPALRVKGIKAGEPNREFLTLEELKRLAQTDTDLPVLKQAALFSALTGLRWSDIQNLTWGQVQHSEMEGYFIRFVQQKTKGVEMLPISKQAFVLMGERGQSGDKIFKGLKYSAWNNLKIAQWVMRAGITKTITFHCFRHTYATLQISLGTDIYTISKMLGHRDLKTTQIYTKVIDKLKRDAADKIPNLM